MSLSSIIFDSGVLLNSFSLTKDIENFMSFNVTSFDDILNALLSKENLSKSWSIDLLASVDNFTVLKRPASLSPACICKVILFCVCGPLDLSSFCSGIIFHFRKSFNWFSYFCILHFPFWKHQIQQIANIFLYRFQM